MNEELKKAQDRLDAIEKQLKVFEYITINNPDKLEPLRELNREKLKLIAYIDDKKNEPFVKASHIAKLVQDRNYIDNAIEEAEKIIKGKLLNTDKAIHNFMYNHQYLPNGMNVSELEMLIQMEVVKLMLEFYKTEKMAIEDELIRLTN